MTLRLDDAVAEVNRLTLKSGLKAVERLGRYLLETFFEGETGRFVDEHGDHATWRALERHPQLTPAASTLWYAVRTVEQLEELPAGIGRQLTANHHRPLIHLDAGLKLELAWAVVREGWSVRRLRAEIKARHPPAEPGVARTQAISLLARHSRIAAEAPDELFDALGAEARAQLREEVMRGLEAVELLTVRVGIALRGRVLPTSERS